MTEETAEVNRPEEIPVPTLGDYEPEHFDFRPPDDWQEESEESPNTHLLSLVDQFLEASQAERVVREHIPTFVMLVGTKIADILNAYRPVHYYGPDIPFRYVVHLTQLGASGTYKGATYDAFSRLVGRSSTGERELFPTEEFKGGSIESLRGGVSLLSGDRAYRPGGIETNYSGFIYVPEFTQLADLARERGGAIQSIVAWADAAGKMTYDTISGMPCRFYAPASLVLGLQTAKLTDVEQVVIGWNRRSVYDYYAIPRTPEILPENRREALPIDSGLLHGIRKEITTLARGWSPSRIDWRGFHEWLSKAYQNQVAVAQDEQMLYSLALGYHIVSGGSWTGVVHVGVSDDLNRILERILHYKRLARVSVTRRTMAEARYVIEDPYVLGDGSRSLAKNDLMRIVAARLSIGEELAVEAITALEHEGYLRCIVETSGETERAVYKLEGR